MTVPTNSYIELSKGALKANIAFIREIIGSYCKFSSVVKGNAYGHSIDVFVPLAEECGLNHFSVYSAHEAYKVYKACSGKSTIMIMGTATEDDIEWAVTHNVEFFVFDMFRLKTAARLAEKHQNPACIHIEIETGLNRTGFEPGQLSEAIDFIEQHKALFRVKGICSHLAGAESIGNYHRIQKQIKLFRKTGKFIRKTGFKGIAGHLACSAAIINYPETILDLARVGIMQYGFWPSREVKVSWLTKQPEMEDPLLRVITWKTRVAGLKEVKAGEFIGYGNAVLAEINMKVAIIPVGYSDGYSRALSNSGKVLIRGKRVDVIGFVNMNITMVDVTHVDHVSVNDEVVLIGSQGDMNITVSSFSELSSLLNYEMLSRLPQDIPRIVTA